MFALNVQKLFLKISLKKHILNVTDVKRDLILKIAIAQQQ